MNTNQLPAVINEFSEYAPMVDLTAACLHCLIEHTTCAVKHPTAAQQAALRSLEATA